MRLVSYKLSVFIVTFFIESCCPSLLFIYRYQQVSSLAPTIKSRLKPYSSFTFPTSFEYTSPDMGPSLDSSLKVLGIRSDIDYVITVYPYKFISINLNYWSSRDHWNQLLNLFVILSYNLLTSDNCILGLGQQ